MTTLREHLEAILLVQRPGAGRVPEWNEAANAVSEHAVAALAILDDAEREERITSWEECEWEFTDNRLVPDPEGFA